MIDRVVADLGRRLVEVPVGFKWFVDGLVDGSIGFGGEESAGASFLRRDGTRLDDRQGRDHRRPARVRADRDGRAQPGRGLRGADGAVRRPGLPPDRRAGDARAEGARSGRLTPADVTATTLAGDPITAILTTAPGNGAPIGGLKVVTARRLVRRPAVGHGERRPRSTRRASAARSTSGGCSRRRRRSSRPRRPSGHEAESPTRRRSRRRRRRGTVGGAWVAGPTMRSAVGDGSLETGLAAGAERVDPLGDRALAGAAAVRAGQEGGVVTGMLDGDGCRGGGLAHS